MKRSFSLLFCLLFILVILDLLLLSFWLKHQESKPSQSVIELKGTYNYVNFGRNLGSLVNQKGIAFTINTIKQGLQKGDITMNQCHSLTHLVGHIAYTRFSDNLDRLLESVKNDLLLCGGAFPHGIEAEITLSSKDPITTLSNLCDLVLKKSPGFPCYHGAGHAYMSESLDVNKSLLRCDSLRDGATRDLSNCYRGIFSEYAFQIAGVDGDTGLSFPGGPKIKLPVPNPLDFCQSLPVKYHDACASQLTTSINRFEECIKPFYSSTIQTACMRMVSAVIAQRELDQTNTVKVPSYILSLSDDLRMAYIEGIAGEFQAFVNSGVTKNWKPICNSFLNLQDIQRCSHLFGGS